MVEHANAYASIARGGSYKDLTYVLEMKNSAGEVIESWSDPAATPVVDPQVAYMISNILADGSARFSIYAAGGSESAGYVIPGVWTATKTGTTTTTNSAVTKDSLMESYSTAVSTLVWNGNHDGSGLTSNTHDIARLTMAEYMGRVHTEVYEPDGRWHPGDQPAKPDGIQTLTVNGQTDIWPSWYNAKNSGVTKESLTFNKYNHLLAAACTPEEYKIQVEVTKTIDPMTGNAVYSVPAPYNRDQNDTCDYEPPRVSLSISGCTLNASIRKGTYDLAGATLYVNGVEKGGVSTGGGAIYTLDGSEKSASLNVTDSSGFTSSGEISITSSDSCKKSSSPTKTVDDNGSDKNKNKN